MNHLDSLWALAPNKWKGKIMCRYIARQPLPPIAVFIQAQRTQPPWIAQALKDIDRKTEQRKQNQIDLISKDTGLPAWQQYLRELADVMPSIHGPIVLNDEHETFAPSCAADMARQMNNRHMGLYCGIDLAHHLRDYTAINIFKHHNGAFEVYDPRHHVSIDIAGKPLNEADMQKAVDAMLEYYGKPRVTWVIKPPHITSTHPLIVNSTMQKQLKWEALLDPAQHPKHAARAKARNVIKRLKRPTKTPRGVIVNLLGKAARR